MEPIIISTAETMKASVQFVALDVDENPRIARERLIQMVPTFLLFARGEEIERIENVTNQKHLSSTIKMHLPDTSEEVSDHTNSVN